MEKLTEDQVKKIFEDKVKERKEKLILQLMKTFKDLDEEELNKKTIIELQDLFHEKRSISVLDQNIKDFGMDRKTINAMRYLSNRDLIEDSGIDIRVKDDWHWYHMFVPLFMWFYGFFNPEMKKKFYEGYYTMFFSTLYVPVTTNVKETLDNKDSIIKHEYQHYLEYRDRKFGYVWDYLFKREKRLAIETRGYFWNVYYDGLDAEHTVISNLSGPAYSWIVGQMCSEDEAKVIFNKMLDICQNLPVETDDDLFRRVRNNFKKYPYLDIINQPGPLDGDRPGCNICKIATIEK